MKKRNQKLAALLSALTVCVATLAGCGSESPKASMPEQSQSQTSTVQAETKVEETVQAKEAKYIFLFIGDGMSYPQIQSASYYLNAITDDADGTLRSESKLSFMSFPVAGSAQTYDSTSFCPDSASTATSLSTGYKTYSGTINMDETKTIAYETITEKLKAQKNFKIGVITSVNLNHATPAAFYAHQASRNSYYDIGLEMIDSNFDYFAGGALLAPTGAEKDQEDIYEVAKKAGYKVVNTQAEAKALTSSDGKAIVISEVLADADAMSYSLDSAKDEWTLADYVEKGIEVLDNETGFFMMVEGGKIDWACHANDAASSIGDTKALSDAVDKAIAFYNKHKEETLIIVTGDHETGGLTIGYAGTNYDTFLQNLEGQKISYAKYSSDYVTKYKEEKTDFETVMKDVEELFGLLLPNNTNADSKLVLTEYELGKIKTAYTRTMEIGTAGQKDMTQEEYVLYGTYDPLTVTLTHVLNNKSGISFSSYAHTGLPVAVFAMGNGDGLFEGYYDNTNIYFNLEKLTGVK